MLMMAVHLQVTPMADRLANHNQHKMLLVELAKKLLLPYLATVKRIHM
jgi:hypothetical protein